MPIAGQEIETGNVRFKDIHSGCNPGVKRPPSPYRCLLMPMGVSDLTLEHSCRNSQMPQLCLPGAIGKGAGRRIHLTSASRPHRVHLLGRLKCTIGTHSLCPLSRLPNFSGPPSITHFLFLPLLCFKAPML